MMAAALLIERIIKEQELIIGPLAWREAKKVKGLAVTSSGAIKVAGSGKKVLGDLVGQYEKLFGPASRDVCREAVKALIPQASKNDIPEVLR